MAEEVLRRWLAADPGAEHRALDVIGSLRGVFVVFVAIEIAVCVALRRHHYTLRHTGALGDAVAGVGPRP